MKHINESKVVRAYKKVEQIKKYYWYLATAIFATIVMLGMAIFFNAIEAPIFLIYMFLAMPFVFWIIALTEYVRVFDRNSVFGKRWEERKIKQFMEKDRLESEKYL